MSNIGEYMQGYMPQGSKRAAGAKHILLVYCGYYEKKGSGKLPCGQWTKDTFRPYVAHLDKSGEPDDFFFDTFLFLALRTPASGSLHRFYEWVIDSVPGAADDWGWIIRRVFEENRQLFALNEAVAEAKEKLGRPDHKTKVLMMLPFPDSQSVRFGIGSRAVPYSLKSTESRNAAVRWYIDAFLEAFRKADLQHLELLGFYWMQEDVDPGITGELDNIRFTLDYLHGQGLVLGWTPWWGAEFKADAERFGFDFSILQPNHYTQEETTYERIREAAQLAAQTGQGIEVELDSAVLSSQKHRETFYHYLKGGVAFGYMREAVMAYYQDVHALYELYHEGGERGRKVYDDIYAFTKGTYIG
ncbi:DUF4855 domain-containing protein [Paenibacillus sp. MBLB4367]|uniref:DUF4855 domain-containing protein n=1 Tax=Paenibacillus sp. MBLB4367 TaxID=3384767 RepID=UPI00390841F1